MHMRDTRGSDESAQDAIRASCRGENSGPNRVAHRNVLKIHMVCEEEMPED